MNPAIRTWLIFRALRWLLWIAFAIYNIEFLVHRANHVNTFGHLLRTTEACMFGLGVAAVFAGFFELMMRERAGIQAPEFGQLIPPKERAALIERR